MTLALAIAGITLTNAQAFRNNLNPTFAKKSATMNLQDLKTSKVVVNKEFKTNQKMETFTVARSMKEMNFKKIRKAEEDYFEAIYLCPEGHLWWGMMEDWRSYNLPFMQTPGMVYSSFRNVSDFDESKDVSFVWTLGQNEMDMDDEYNGFVETMWGNATLPLLTMTQGQRTSTYQISGTVNNQEMPGYWFAGSDSISALSHCCPANGIYAGFEELDECYKTNTIFRDGKKCVGFMETFDKPQDITYVSSLFINGFLENYDNKKPKLADGTKLTATIYEVVEVEEGDSTVTRVSDTPYATATCIAENITIEEDQYASLSFYFQKEDPMLGIVNKSILLPNSEFVIRFTGFENMQGELTVPFSSAYPDAGHSYVILDDGSVATIGYSNQPSIPQCNIAVQMNAAMPFARLIDGSDFATLRFANEGGESMTDTYVDENQDTVVDNSIYIYTLTANLDTWVINTPDWVTNVSGEYMSDYGVLVIMAEAEALPEGTKGRASEGYLSVYGKKIPLKFVQGENIEPASQEIMLSQEGYATFYDSSYDYIIPTGVKAYAISAVQNDKLVKTEVTNVIPKGVAVLLESEDKIGGYYTLDNTLTDAKYDGANLLYGNDNESITQAPGNCLYYKLAYGKQDSKYSNSLGWYWGAENGAAFRIEGHKAFLAVPAGAAARSYNMDGEASGINIATDNVQKASQVYNLQGIRVAAPQQKGVYIQNNKKVIIK